MAKTFTPAGEEELADLLRAQSAARAAIGIRGGGTRSVGNPVTTDAVMETIGIKGITDYEPGSLTIIAKAGTKLKSINKALAAENQQLPFEPPDHGALFGRTSASTIGGVVAAGAAGPRAIQAGGARDSLIGVRLVTGDGDIVKNGGRVMKNVTGYDLVKLVAGSHGTLGVLTEVAFKVLPKPEAAATVRVTGIDASEAVDLMSKALCSPFDVSGAAYLGPGLKDGPAAIVRVEGFANSVAYRADRLVELLGKDMPGGGEIDIVDKAKSVAGLWGRVSDLSDFAAGSPAQTDNGGLWKVVLKPGLAPQMLELLKPAFDFDFVLDRGGGLVWIMASGDQFEGDNGDAAVIAAHDAVREAAQQLGGHAALFRAGSSVRDRVEAFHPQPARLAEISAGLRRQFDPAGILNPGRMVREAV